MLNGCVRDFLGGMNYFREMRGVGKLCSHQYLNLWISWMTAMYCRKYSCRLRCPRCLLGSMMSFADLSLTCGTSVVPTIRMVYTNSDWIQTTVGRAEPSLAMVWPPYAASSTKVMACMKVPAARFCARKKHKLYGSLWKIVIGNINLIQCSLHPKSKMEGLQGKWDPKLWPGGFCTAHFLRHALAIHPVRAPVVAL